MCMTCYCHCQLDLVIEILVRKDVEVQKNFINNIAEILTNATKRSQL